MIGLVVATHASLGKEFLEAASLIIGPVAGAQSVSIRRDDSMDKIRQAIKAAVEKVSEGGEGVLIMTDMFGGTPANVSASLISEFHIEILTGVNLPMVLKFFNSRQGIELGELAAMLKAYSQQNISLVSDYLKK